jgi:hypothetical protein
MADGAESINRIWYDKLAAMRSFCPGLTLKWIFGVFIQFAYSVAVESFLIYLKDGAL